MSEQACARTERLIGRDGVVRLAGAHVLVAGLGGVGGHCAEALARAGVGTLTLIDPDRVVPSNLNRQVVALHSTLGRLKVEVMAERLRDIQPAIAIDPQACWLDAEHTDAIVAAAAPDAIADCIDGVAAKVALIAAAQRQDRPLIASLGAGGRLDPTRVRLGRLNQVQGCGLARAVRRRLKAHGLAPRARVVYSDEPPRLQPMTREAGSHPHEGSRTIGTIAYLPAQFGLMLAGEILRLLLADGQPPTPGSRPGGGA
jgi:tRNA A37 threonylcarbamoyladenosine dehydratase